MSMNRGWALLLVVPFWLSASSPASAQGFGGINVAELFQALDANNDMQIDRNEVPEAGRSAFDRLAKLADTNADGKIDQQEYRRVFERIRASALGVIQKVVSGFGTFDTNGDGKLSRDEFPGAPPLFQRMDADENGFVTAEEARKLAAAGGNAGMPGAGGIAARLKAMDKNGDGKISRDEYTGPTPLFDRIDRDRDGMIAPDEVRTFRPNDPNAPKKAASPKVPAGDELPKETPGGKSAEADGGAASTPTKPAR